MMRRWHFLMVKRKLRPFMTFQMMFLEKIKEKYPTLNDTPINKVIMESISRFLSARYNESQSK